MSRRLYPPGPAAPLIALPVLAMAVLAMAVLAMLGACSALDPFPTAPAGGFAGAGAPRRVAICYNTLSTPLAAVQAEAQRECDTEPPRSLAVPSETDWYLQHCPLLLPARASFVCAPQR